MRKVLLIAAVVAMGSFTLSSCAEEELPTPSIENPMLDPDDDDDNGPVNCPPEGCN